MARRMDGNGHSQVKIIVHERAEDYVIFAPDTIATLPEQIAIYISRSVENWLKGNPTFRVRCALPITDEGKTVAVHLWFDR